MRGKNPRSEAMPPVLGLPPAIQKMSPKQASACAAESALVAFESLTNSTLPLRPTSSMRCGRPGNDRIAGPFDAVGGSLAPAVVDVDNGGAAVLHARDQALLDGGVVRQRPVAIEVILGDVEQDPDRGIERRRKVDLVGRDFDHVYASDARRLEREDGGADIAAELNVMAGAGEEMRAERRRGRFPVGAGDGDERRLRG